MDHQIYHLIIYKNYQIDEIQLIQYIHHHNNNIIKISLKRFEQLYSLVEQYQQTNLENSTFASHSLYV